MEMRINSPSSFHAIEWKAIAAGQSASASTTGRKFLMESSTS
jgi:hypothetical protein